MAKTREQMERYRKQKGLAKTEKNQMGINDGITINDKDNREELLPAELNINTAKGNSIDFVLNRFKSKYGTANREYAIAVDEQGFTHQHIKGGRHSVGISGDRGETIIHNHPSGSNFSGADLMNVATTNAKGVVAISSNKTTKGVYRFTKTDRFRAKQFITGLNNARWDKSLGYNKGLQQWLKANQKTYGYKYSARGVKNADW